MSSTHTPILVRGCDGEPRRLYLADFDELGPILTSALTGDGRRVGWSRRDVFLFDSVLFDRLRHAYHNGDRAALESDWAAAQQIDRNSATLQVRLEA